MSLVNICDIKKGDYIRDKDGPLKAVEDVKHQDGVGWSVKTETPAGNTVIIMDDEELWRIDPSQF